MNTAFACWWSWCSGILHSRCVLVSQRSKASLKMNVALSPLCVAVRGSCCCRTSDGSLLFNSRWLLISSSISFPSLGECFTSQDSRRMWEKWMCERGMTASSPSLGAVFSLFFFLLVLQAIFLKDFCSVNRQLVIKKRQKLEQKGERMRERCRQRNQGSWRWRWC